MSKIAYIDWTPRGDSAALINQAESIIGEYRDQGYVLTLRQLYYQFVSRAIIPNTERSYKNLGSLITKARMAGYISWYSIEDRGREFMCPWFREDAKELIDDLPANIRFDRWARQENYVEVWVEKEALSGVIAKACKSTFTPYLACKGYLSASEAWRAGQRLRRAANEGKDVHIIHLGDHDPSGIDMTRDNDERLSLFSREHVHVHRIALNMDQVEEYGPPPNPAKLSDTRARDYITQYGYESWELDALEPKVIEELVGDEISTLIDWNTWGDTDEDETEVKDLLTSLSNRWDDVVEFLS